MSALLPIDLAKIMPFATTWLFATIRISSFFVAAPIFSQTNIPKLAKVLLSMLIGGVLIQHLSPSKPITDAFFSSNGILILIQQIIIGFAMGVILQMTFEVLHLAGHYIATAMQLNFAMGFSPDSHHQENILGNMLFVFGMLVFFTLHGPILLISLIQKSFDIFPISTQLLSIEQIKHIPLFGTKMFAYSLLLALPVMATLLLSNLALAIMTRLSPSMNIFSIGFPVSMLVGFITIIFSLPFVLTHFGDIIHQTIQEILTWQVLGQNVR